MEMKMETTILWLDDQRNPETYFNPTKQRKNSLTWINNNDFYTNNVFNIGNYKFIWVKTFNEFKNFFLNNNTMPVLISYDYDLSKTDSKHNGDDCAKWLVNYCKQNNLEFPKYHIHSANKAKSPIINNILTINENDIAKIVYNTLKLILNEIK